MGDVQIDAEMGASGRWRRRSTIADRAETVL